MKLNGGLGEVCEGNESNSTSSYIVYESSGPLVPMDVI